MNIKNFFNNLTKYNKPYNFSIMNNKVDNTPAPSEKEPKVFSNINENLDFLKSKYNVLINSDIKIREFNMFANNKNHKCFIIYMIETLFLIDKHESCNININISL